MRYNNYFSLSGYIYTSCGPTIHNPSRFGGWLFWNVELDTTVILVTWPQVWQKSPHHHSLVFPPYMCRWTWPSPLTQKLSHALVEKIVDQSQPSLPLFEFGQILLPQLIIQLLSLLVTCECTCLWGCLNHLTNAKVSGNG